MGHPGDQARGIGGEVREPLARFARETDVMDAPEPAAVLRLERDHGGARGDGRSGLDGGHLRDLFDGERHGELRRRHVKRPQQG